MVFAGLHALDAIAEDESFPGQQCFHLFGRIPFDMQKPPLREDVGGSVAEGIPLPPITSSTPAPRWSAAGRRSSASPSIQIESFASVWPEPTSTDRRAKMRSTHEYFIIVDILAF